MITKFFQRYKEFDGLLLFSFWSSVVLVVIFFLFGIITYTGWHIPTDDEIHYTQGKIRVVKEGYYQKIGSGDANHVKLYTNDNKTLHLTCSYTAFYYTQYSSCYGVYGKKEFINIVDGKQGVVGWYIQKPFFGLKNPYPQLIYLSIIDQEGNTQIIFDKASRIERMKKGVYFRIFMFFFSSFLVFYIVLLPVYRLYYPKIQSLE